MFRPGTENLPIYTVGEEPRWISKLDANERSARLPASVNKAIAARLRATDSTRYPDMGASSLRRILAEAYQVDLEQVLVGNGSSELIAAVCATFGGRDRAIAYHWPSFSMYPIYAAMADSPTVAVPLGNNFELSVADILETLNRCRAKLLILCNPNNPTGNAIPAGDLRVILEQSSCPVLVDEAYMEYYGQSCIPWLKEFPRLMVARTFSKAYGLAAARIGYLLASPDLCAAIGKRLLPYHTNAYSLTLAEVCFSHRNLILDEVRRTVRRRDHLLSALSRSRHIRVFPSETNFLLVKVTDPATLHGVFAEQGIGVRNLSHTPELAGCLRITLGSSREMAQVQKCLRSYEAMQTEKERQGNE